MGLRRRRKREILCSKSGEKMERNPREAFEQRTLAKSDRPRLKIQSSGVSTDVH